MSVTCWSEKVAREADGELTLGDARAQARRSQLHSFSFFLRLKRGGALGFAPIVALW